MELYLFEEMAEVADRHWWFAARREILAAVIGRMALPAPSEARIIEIGCGTGSNLPMLSGFGHVQAMEADAYALQQARMQDNDVRPGRLGDSLPFQEYAADLVCLLDVLEHIEDDISALAAAARLLRPNGRMLVTVPAYACLFGPHDVAHRHFRRYTASRLKGVAQAAGLKVERMGYFNTLLFPVIAVGRVADRWLGRETTHGTALPAPWVNSLLHGLFSLEAPVVSRQFLPFGTSVIAVLAPNTGLEWKS